MKEDSKDKSDVKKNYDSVKSINKKEEAHPAQANEGKEDASYEEETLMDGVGSVEDEERLKGEDTTKKKKH